MIKGELQVKYEALIHYFLTGGKSVDEISYIQLTMLVSFTINIGLFLVSK